MQKQLFNENGLQQLLVQLYQLPNHELIENAQMLRNDPLFWINRHFDLDHEQLAYLQQMSTAMLHFIAAQGCIALEHRLPVNLVKHLADGDKPKQDKLFITNSSLSLSAHAKGLVYEGSIQFEVSYVDKP